MSEKDSNLDKIKLLEESYIKISDKNKFLLKKVEQIHNKTIDLHEKINQLETNIKILESVDFDELKQNLNEIHSKVRVMEITHGNRSENWKRVLDFLVQLLWVSMAAYLLTKLGLQAPL